MPDFFDNVDLKKLYKQNGHEKNWLLELREKVLDSEKKDSEKKDSEKQDLNQQDKSLQDLFFALKQQTTATKFLNHILNFSPFLRESFMRSPEFLSPLLHKDIAKRLDEILHDITKIDNIEAITEAQLMAALRQKKREAHSLIALGDLAKIFTTEQSCQWLSKLAEYSLSTALRFLLREANKQGHIQLKNTNQPEEECGLIILGMGKLGGCELNYSSDIDLIVLIDETSPYIGDVYQSVDVFSKMMRRLIRIMQERTSDGYVFRVDLRLRPDPGSTPMALPVGAALHYYEGRGQNWERAAMIKARPVAGDIIAGNRFLQELSPFIWRKYLDYAAIADVHSIKRQIHAYKGHGEIAVLGHNVKLGRGGIREIEFFVQTQQLIAGGRLPLLRGKRTVEMLWQLYQSGWISQEARDNLCQAYWFIRDIEHRIQMLNDEQTHNLPENDQEFSAIAGLMGYKNSKDFTNACLKSFKIVEKHYAALFEQEPGLGVDTGNLVFTGEDDDPETLVNIKALGFERPSDICRIIRTWHFGRYRATQSAEARERLTELTPLLLKSFGETKRADEAFLRFDAFLQGLPAGIQLFSLLQSNPTLLNMLVLIMSAAPRLADIITRKPHVFDGMLDPTIFAEMPTKNYLDNRLEHFLNDVTLYEDILERLRIFAAEQRFLIGIRLLTVAIDGIRAGQAFTDLADLMIAKALDAVEIEFIKRHGKISGGRIGILGMGKLGSHELTAGSDIDIILLYEHNEGAIISDGEKPLYVSQYYMRLTQRLVAALSAPLSEGVLYEVDLRLRPSGNKGPVAVAYAAFGKYQREEAWVWEHLALTRARAIAGDKGFLQKLEQEVAAIIALPRDIKKVTHDVLEMRQLIAQEKPPHNQWDLKTMQGGLVDLEFIAQFAQITHKTDFHIGQTNEEILAKIIDKSLDASDVEQLVFANRLYSNISQMMRLCLHEQSDSDDMPHGLSELLQRITTEPDLSHIISLITENSNNITKIFKKYIG